TRPRGSGSPAGKRRKPVATRGTLESALAAVRAALLSHPKAFRCGGANTTPGEELKSQILESNERTLSMRVTMPQAHFSFKTFGNQDFAEMEMEGMEPTAPAGQPAVPVITKQFGIPTGADVRVQVTNVSSYTLDGVNLLPNQPEPVDQVQQGPDNVPEETFFDKPFVQDRGAYASRSPFPADPADGGAAGQMRDLRVGGANLAGGQYMPRQKRLRVITGMDVKIDFGGDNQGTFGDARLNSPFNATFQRLYDSAFENWDVIRRRPGTIVPPFCGEEVLIITSEALRPAANKLRDQKQAEGYLTTIRETGATGGDIGTTHTEVRDFIRSRINGNCWIRPSYVIFVGDTSHVPTWLVLCNPANPADPPIEECNIASDLPHALADDSDYLADVAIGRISANNIDQANTVVDKIINYETTAPAPEGDDFYRHFTVTSYFEPTYICELNEGQSGTPNCDGNNPPVTGHWVFHPEITQDARGFTKTSERVRDEMISKSYNVDRLYYANPANDPVTYHDGTPIPNAIRKPPVGTFAWDADTTDFIDAFNDGRSLVFHRDHGSPHQWYHPDLHTGNIPSLTNGAQLPVVFGINCSSAAYDTPGNPSLVEQLMLHPAGGAVGGFGDTRVSGTWANNSISIGFFDAMFPDLVEDYGADTPLARMGDVLLAGKQYLATAHAGAVYSHGHLYGYFGDPTMQAWVGPPITFDPDRFTIEIKRDQPPIPRPPGPGPEEFYVLVQVAEPLNEGTLATLVGPRGDVVGRGIVQNGQAVIFPDTRPSSTSQMQVHLQDEGFLSAQVPVQGK
ncbi:MAG: C25 family cysteine peptidase, partial [Actinomycetota bacterium]|nr:C25 family cysteine peptidase [Actinomycetota bacterium]